MLPAKLVLIINLWTEGNYQSLYPRPYFFENLFPLVESEGSENYDVR